MGKRFLIDTNVIIEYIGKLLPNKAMAFISETIDAEFIISVINKIEVLGYNNANDDMQDFIDLALVYDLDNRVVTHTIQIRKTYKTKLPDAIIAATALVNNLTLITRNAKDFDKIEGLEVLNPYDI
jgi:toxin FitB